MALIRRGSIVILIVALLFTSFGCIPLSEEESIALDCIKTLRKKILKPDSIEIYSCHVCMDYKGLPASFIYFGALNGFGGITDDYAFVSSSCVQFKSVHQEAFEREDWDTCMANEAVAWVNFAVSMGSEKWVSIDTEEIVKRLKK